MACPIHNVSLKTRRKLTELNILLPLLQVTLNKLKDHLIETTPLSQFLNNLNEQLNNLKAKRAKTMFYKNNINKEIPTISEK